MSGVTHLLIHRTTLQRKRPVDLGAGRFRDAFVDVAVNIRMRVWSMGGQDAVLAQQLRVQANAVCYFEPDQEVQPDDEFEHDGQRYRVTARVKPSKPHHLKTLCYTVQTPTPET